MRWITTCICLGLAGCVTAQDKSPSITPGTPTKLTAGDVESVKAGVTRRLKDPESARFGAMAAVSDEKGNVTVCGMVNAKNSYGGYTGSKPYIGMMLTKGGSFFVISMGGDEIDNGAVAHTCGLNGISVASLS